MLHVNLVWDLKCLLFLRFAYEDNCKYGNDDQSEKDVETVVDQFLTIHYLVVEEGLAFPQRLLL